MPSSTTDLVSFSFLFSCSYPASSARAYYTENQLEQWDRGPTSRGVSISQELSFVSSLIACVFVHVLCIDLYPPARARYVARSE